MPTSRLAPVLIVYCELGARIYLTSVDVLQLDYGQGKPSLVQDSALAVASSCVRQLASSTAALNYLHRVGQEWVSTTAIIDEADKSGTAKTYLHYLLRRRTLSLLPFRQP